MVQCDNSVLQCVAVCCSVVQCDNSVEQRGAAVWCCSVVQYGAVWCCSMMLQCVAIWCSVVQCVAICCSVC